MLSLITVEVKPLETRITSQSLIDVHNMGRYEYSLLLWRLPYSEVAPGYMGGDPVGFWYDICHAAP